MEQPTVISRFTRNDVRYVIYAYRPVTDEEASSLIVMYHADLRKRGDPLDPSKVHPIISYFGYDE